MQRHLRHIVILVAGSLPCFEANGSPAEMTTAKKGSRTNLYSTAHLGFAVDHTSSTGFAKTKGSMAFLDLGYSLPNLDVGLRTLMRGGRQTDREYYRIGAGPMVRYAINRNWAVHGSLTTFRENAIDDDGDKTYRSRGQTLLAGWEKTILFHRSFEFSMGAWLSAHRGDFQLTDTAAVNSTSHYKDTSRNQGVSRGIDLSMRIFL